MRRMISGQEDGECLVIAVDQKTTQARREQVHKLPVLSRQKLINEVYDDKEPAKEEMTVMYVLQRVLKERVYPIYKFVDPNKDRFKRPDFTDLRGMQNGDLTLIMANKIFDAMNMTTVSDEEKARFWHTYNIRISRWFSLNRCANTKAVKSAFVNSKFLDLFDFLDPAIQNNY